MGIRCDTMHWSRIQSDYNKTPGARGGHTMTLDSTETRIIMFGGQHPGPDECFLYMNDLHVFDVETLEWFSPRVTGKLPPPRSFHSAFCIETRFFVSGVLDLMVPNTTMCGASTSRRRFGPRCKSQASHPVRGTGTVQLCTATN